MDMYNCFTPDVLSSERFMMHSGHSSAIDLAWLQKDPWGFTFDIMGNRRQDSPEERQPINPEWQRRNAATLQDRQFISLPFPPVPPRTASPGESSRSVRKTITFAPPLLPDDLAHAEALQFTSSTQSTAKGRSSGADGDDDDHDDDVEAELVTDSKEDDDSSGPPVLALAKFSFDIDTRRESTWSPQDEPINLSNPGLDGQADPFSLLGLNLDKDVMDTMNVYTSLTSIPELSRKFMPIVGILQSRRNNWMPQALQHPASANSLMAYVLTSAFTPRELVNESRKLRVLNEALQSTNALLRSSTDNTSWTAVMSVVLLLITAQQMGDATAAEAHAAGLAAMLKARAGPAKFEEEAIRCRRTYIKSSQRGFRELYERGLTANDRRVLFMHLFTNPDFMAACNTDANSLNLMLQHLLVASNSPTPATAAPNPLEAVISNTFLIIGNYYRCRSPDYRIQAVAAAVADTAALYGLVEPIDAPTRKKKKKKIVHPSTSPPTDIFTTQTSTETTPSIDLEAALTAHPGFHIWVALTHGSFAARPHARAGFARMLRSAAALQGVRSFDEATEYVDDAFCQSPVILFPHLITFWIEVFGQLLPGDAEDVGQVLGRADSSTTTMMGQVEGGREKGKGKKVPKGRVLDIGP